VIVRAELAEVLGVLTPVLDIVRTPVAEAEPPSWCIERGWAEFLLALSQEELTACEAKGLEADVCELSDAPDDFRALFREVRRLTRLPRVSVAPMALSAAALRGVSARKREQLGALLGAMSPLASRCQRIVDVGAGGGHFARLAAEVFDRETVALDRDAARLRTFTDRRQQRAREVGVLDVRFVVTDLSRDQLELRATDLAVGLHACGELGDRLVLAAAAARCDLALISCCLQKMQAPLRLPLSSAAGSFALQKAELGLTNLVLQPEGVEATQEDNLRARAARLALRQLLRARGLDVRPGEEMRGVNRRRAQAGFEELAARVLAQRQLAPATGAELRFHASQAERDYAAIRRYSLPRNLLARLVELAVVLDRASALEERDLHVSVAQLFEQRLTPRNLLLLASAGTPLPQ
jgi:hypothetical protein